MAPSARRRPGARGISQDSDFLIYVKIALTRPSNAGDRLAAALLAGVVRKRLKLKLGSKKVDGTRVYWVATGDSGKPGARRSKRQSS